MGWIKKPIRSTSWIFNDVVYKLRWNGNIGDSTTPYEYFTDSISVMRFARCLRNIITSRDSTMRTIKRRYKVYNVDWYTKGGHNYRTTTNCSWDDVKECRKAARLMGETIKYEFDHYKEYIYKVK